MDNWNCFCSRADSVSQQQKGDTVNGRAEAYKLSQSDLSSDSAERPAVLISHAPRSGSCSSVEGEVVTSSRENGGPRDRATSAMSRSSLDVPKIDSGVRMLCMDGGGAKGVIEATILDKIFITVASTLKYKVQVLNWITLVFDKDKEKDKDKDKNKDKDKDKDKTNKDKEKDKTNKDTDNSRDRTLTQNGHKDKKNIEKNIDFVLAKILSILNSGPDSKRQFKKIQRIDRTYDITDMKTCIVLSGAVDRNDMYKPFTHEQKSKILADEMIRDMPGVEIKDFLHGASKYWVFLDSDHSDTAREQIKTDIKPCFTPLGDKSEVMKIKCTKMLVPASYLFLNQKSSEVEEFERKDLLAFYWDEPVLTRHANQIRDKLLTGGSETEDSYKEKYSPSIFIAELQARDMFDLLIGTSTGSILAFGMGYKGLTPQECRDVYLDTIKNIFSTKYDKSTSSKIGLGDTLFRTIGDLVGQGHYSIDGVRDALTVNFDTDYPTTRKRMGEGDHRTECVCACVALNWGTQTLETFDTHNPRFAEWDLTQFLTASSDAPVYFTTPFTVKSPDGQGIEYIDGGLGANCPAVQGIDLAKERWKGAEIELILSLGAGKDKMPPAIPKTGGDWLKTLCTMVTDGDNIWQRFVLPLLNVDEACKHTERLRIQPRMELANFKADSTRVKELCQLAEEWLNTDAGFEQVTEAAGMIIAKSMKLEVESRVLTEQDLLDWLAQTLPIGKSIFKSRSRTGVTTGGTAGITNDSNLDMKFGRELHSLYVSPNSKLVGKFPAVHKQFLYIPKPVSVGQTDLRFTVKLDHDIAPVYSGKGQRVLKLHCPDNHEVRIICNLDLYDTKSVYKISNLVTVPLEETEQFHRLVHEASKEISQLHEADRTKAEEKLCNAMKLNELPEFEETRERYSTEHFMRVQAYFYLWKKTVSEVSLKALNETLIQVGMKKRPWPKKGRLGEPDVTVRTVIPAPPENMMFSIAVEYFQERLHKAKEQGNKSEEKRYLEFMRHLGAHPAKKEAEGATFQKRLFKTVFKQRRKDSKPPKIDGTTKAALRKKKVKREEVDIEGEESFFKKSRRFFGKKRSDPVPEKLQNSPYADPLPTPR